MKKLFVLALLVLPVAIWATGARETTEEPVEQIAVEPTEVTISVPTGAPTVAISRLAAENLPSAEGYELKWDVVTSPDLMGARLVSGEADIAIVPTNLAARLYNQGKDVRLVGAVVWGILYVAGTEPAESWEDLRGKEVGIFGRGLTPDLVFRHVLSENGLDPDVDLTLNYFASATEIAPALITGKLSMSLIPEPMLSMVLSRNENASILFDLQQEWADVSRSASSYPQAVLVAQADFLDEHPDFFQSFVREFSQASLWVNENPQQAGEYSAALMEGTNPQILTAAIPRLKIDFVDAADSRPAIEEYLGVLLQANPDSLSGDIPSDGFYEIR
ncbi:ABC transporter substrate-binding protein [Salinispira pacifica]|uniref:ABC-type nitrate/sulfonate/bicarbonate transport system, periplasmic component n=1 Tax=Salinispira pacifica TaxID=1307761 RepID=V5WE03_9SPIO|nr:ABC transporter substrate-binding protein [Salinispira pacifica]AHC14018.1 ABC-type nitrate/sulfonate/bicarbonate transport system, periplasmic component [Salinispira pacifica]